MWMVCGGVGGDFFWWGDGVWYGVVVVGLCGDIVWFFVMDGGYGVIGVFCGDGVWVYGDWCVGWEDEFVLDYGVGLWIFGDFVFVWIVFVIVYWCVGCVYCGRFYG